MKITFAIFSKETLLQSLSSLLCWVAMSFFLHQMEEEKRMDEGGGVGGQVLTMQSLVGAPH